MGVFSDLLDEYDKAIAERDARLTELEATVERAFAHANELESAGLVFEADTLRDRLKGRYRNE